MINYILNTSKGAVSYPDNKVVARTSLGFIKSRCNNYLFGLEGYLKALKKELDIRYKVPIFINYQEVYIYTKSLKEYESIFINFTQIKEVINENKSLEIIFNNQDVLKVDISYESYKRLVMTIFKLYKYKESLV